MRKLQTVRNGIKSCSAKTRFYLRTGNGNAIAEFGPALWIVLLGFFFPVLVMLSMALSYGSLMVLNNLQVHEASLLPYQKTQDPAGSVMTYIPTQWQNNGLGKFCNLTSFPQTQVTYGLGATDQNGVQDHMVTVATTATLKPMVSVPFVPGVPGLSAPVTFTITSDRLVENQDNAP
jgi:hypothetical protein